MRSIAVCALSYRRPEGLDRLLTSLRQIEIPPDTDVEVFVLDNDDRAGARDVVAQHQTSSLTIHHEFVGLGSISAGRNAAVAVARPFDFLAFIDDDEWADPRWLVELLAAHDATGATAVIGPVVPEFERPPPAWVVDGEFFERRRHEHLERIRYASTSSVLLDMAAVADIPEPFDEYFGRSGGEDTHLFAELRRRGAFYVWADTAVVHESIPASRVTLRWILRREYRRGQTLSLSLRRAGATPWQLVRRCAHGLVDIAIGFAQLGQGIIAGRARAARGIHRMCFGSGLLTGLMGARYLEYKQAHGR